MCVWACFCVSLCMRVNLTRRPYEGCKCVIIAVCHKLVFQNTISHKVFRITEKDFKESKVLSLRDDEVIPGKELI